MGVEIFCSFCFGLWIEGRCVDVCIDRDFERSWSDGVGVNLSCLVFWFRGLKFESKK